MTLQCQKLAEDTTGAPRFGNVNPLDFEKGIGIADNSFDELKE